MSELYHFILKDLLFNLLKIKYFISVKENVTSYFEIDKIE